MARQSLTSRIGVDQDVIPKPDKSCPNSDSQTHEQLMRGFTILGFSLSLV